MFRVIPVVFFFVDRVLLFDSSVWADTPDEDEAGVGGGRGWGGGGFGGRGGDGGSRSEGFCQGLGRHGGFAQACVVYADRMGDWGGGTNPVHRSSLHPEGFVDGPLFHYSVL